VKHAWIDTQRSAFPLPVLCDALSVSQSGFRAWQAGGTPERKRLTDGQALVLIRTIHQEVRQAYGARRIHAELSGRGYRIGRPDNKKANPRGLAFLLACLGSSTWARTRDLRINSPALYRLSYRGSDGLVMCCRLKTHHRKLFWLLDLGSNQGPTD
jgi:hypothetical protein